LFEAIVKYQLELHAIFVKRAIQGQWDMVKPQVALKQAASWHDANAIADLLYRYKEWSPNGWELMPHRLPGGLVNDMGAHLYHCYVLAFCKSAPSVNSQTMDCFGAMSFWFNTMDWCSLAKNFLENVE
jgi:hypothetical protein